MRKTIGIITLVFNNYGTRLQSYALSRVLSELGYEPSVINLQGFWSASSKLYRITMIIRIMKTYGIKSFSHFLSLVKWVKEQKKYKTNKDVKLLLEKRAASFAKLISLIPYTKEYYSFQDFREGKYPDFDYYLVGSDQTFNGIKVGHQDIFMLDFLRGGEGYTYAASFGMTTIPKRMQQEYLRYINNFKTLLMREEEGVRLCNQLGRTDAKLVLDPTLLLNEDDYNNVYEDEKLVDDDYVLIYSLNYSLKIYDQANKFAMSNKCKMVILKRSACPPNPQEYNNSIELYNVSPGGFLWLIKNAKCVITNSYHALIFSIIYKCPFFIYLDNADEENSRMLTLANSLGLNSQVYWETGSLPRHINIINYRKVYNSLNVQKEASIELLKNSLNVK